MPQQETQPQEAPTNQPSQSNGEDQSLREKLEKVESGQALLQVLSDPEVQKVLQARREGKQVRVESADEDAAPAEPEVDPETLSDEDKVEHQRAQRILDAIDKKLNPYVEDVKLLKGLAEQMQRQEVHGQITKVQSEHKDFDKYRKQMADINRSNPTLTVEELYIVAKARTGDLKLSEPSTFSEKPTPTPRRSADGLKKAETPLGRKGFQSILANALEGKDFSTE